MIKKTTKSSEFSKSVPNKPFTDKDSHHIPITMGIIARSILFNLAFIGGTVVITVSALPFLFFPKKGIFFLARCWIFYTEFLLECVVGITYQIRGRIPKEPVFIASKHQSAWETIMFFKFLNSPACLVKKELFNIPVLGWYFKKSGMIQIERTKSAFPLKSITNQMKQAFREKRSVVMFPEGTRMDPFESKPYKSGIALIYRNFDKEVVPVALNAGLFWGRRSFIKYPGTIIIEFLDPIPAGLSSRKFLETLEHTIETSSVRLREEALLNVKKS